MAGRRLSADALDAPTPPVADARPVNDGGPAPRELRAAIAAGAAAVVSENASLLASNTASNRTYESGSPLQVRAGDLVAGLPDPEFDLVAVNVRVPRYLAQAVDLAAKLTHRPRQAIVADALRGELDPAIVAECRRNLGI